MSRIFLILFLFLFSITTLAQTEQQKEETSKEQQTKQQEKPTPDRWRGLILDETTEEDAIKILGQPKKIENKGEYTYPLNKRLTLDHNSKDVRKLKYEKLEGVKKAFLIFRNNKLVLIHLELEKSIEATSLPMIYDVTFTPKISAFSLTPVEINQGQKYPIEYPSTYYLIALTDKSYVSAQVSNTSMSSLLFGSRRDVIGDKDNAGFPGKTNRIQLISRSLENKQGEEILK